MTKTAANAANGIREAAHPPPAGRRVGRTSVGEVDDEPGPRLQGGNWRSPRDQAVRTKLLEQKRSPGGPHHLLAIERPHPWPQPIVDDGVVLPRDRKAFEVRAPEELGVVAPVVVLTEPTQPPPGATAKRAIPTDSTKELPRAGRSGRRHLAPRCSGRVVVQRFERVAAADEVVLLQRPRRAQPPRLVPRRHRRRTSERRRPWQQRPQCSAPRSPLDESLTTRRTFGHRSESSFTTDAVRSVEQLSTTITSVDPRRVGGHDRVELGLQRVDGVVGGDHDGDVADRLEVRHSALRHGGRAHQGPEPVGCRIVCPSTVPRETPYGGGRNARVFPTGTSRGFACRTLIEHSDCQSRCHCLGGEPRIGSTCPAA